MKKIILLSILSFGVIIVSNAQQYGWKDISANMPELKIFNDVMFIGDEGWIAGDDKVYYTSDGGENFTILVPPHSGVGIVNSVFAKNANEIYIFNNSGEFVKSNDGGETWHSVSDGLESPWPHHMVERFLQVEDELLAVLSNGELWCALVETFAWQRTLPQVEDVRSVVVPA